MTTKVTKESLAENIGRLESYGDLSPNEEYPLKAYRLLIDFMCNHDVNWRFEDGAPVYFCTKCGVVVK